MATGWNSELDREAMFRRVAIVLSSLPTSVANQLLGSIGPDAKQAIRRTMTSLSDVDPLERQRALQAFKVSLQQRPQTQASVIASAAVSDPSPPPPRSTTAGSTVVSGTSVETRADFSSRHVESPLAFLSDVDDQTMIRLLDSESPQAVAVVLASIAPQQAARILPRLRPTVQADAVSRIGRLGEVPEAAAMEVADHFRARLARQHDDRTSTSGRRALDAILAAMPETAVALSAIQPPTAATQVPASGQRSDEQPESTFPPEATSPVSFPTSDLPALDLAHKLRAVDDQSHLHDPAATPAHPAIDSSMLSGELPVSEPENMPEQSGAHRDTTSSNDSPLQSTDSIHQYLTGLPAAELCQALGKVDTRDAMLALCGLPNDVTEAALALLPKAQAKQVRGKMHALGAINLRDIDDAKEIVAQASVAASQSHSPLPVAA